MSRDGLFADAPLDLGRSMYLPGDWTVRTTRIIGSRISQLRSQLRLLAPREPGIYAMLNADGEVIYIGKAKNLRTRLFCYFRTKNRDRKARKIASRARTIIWEVLPSEFTALLRELELIRRWRPVLNVQGQPLRRRHAFICIGHSPAPYLTLTRKRPRHLVAAFGPIPVTAKTRNAVRWLNDSFQLRDCPPGPVELFPAPNPLFPITPPSGCLRLELGHCIGPCIAEVSRSAYHDRVRAARSFLEGDDRSLLETIAARMTAAAQSHRFEAAALLRDKHIALSWIAERLDRLKAAQKTLSFVYPIQSDSQVVWYLVHGARVIACTAKPTDADSAQAAQELLRRVFGSDATPILDAYEPIDSALLIMTWFRKRPQQKKRGLSPNSALRLCETILRPKSSTEN